MSFFPNLLSAHNQAHLTNIPVTIEKFIDGFLNPNKRVAPIVPTPAFLNVQSSYPLITKIIKSPADLGNRPLILNNLKSFFLLVCFNQITGTFTFASEKDLLNPLVYTDSAFYTFIQACLEEINRIFVI